MKSRGIAHAPTVGSAEGPILSAEDPAPESAPPLARLRSGDSEALASLLEQHWEGCVGYARRLLDGRDDVDTAEDLAQEAFVRLWEHRDRWDPETPPKPLLLRILRNLVLNERRRVTVAVKWAHRVAEETQRRVNPTPDQELGAELLRERARSAVAALPPRRREIFHLARDHGLTYQEIAETMGVSRQTVANQMSAALASLRNALGLHR